MRKILKKYSEKLKNISKICFISLFLMCVGAGITYADIRIEEIRIGEHGENTRLVVDMDRKSDFRAFMLEKPYRLIIDMPKISWHVKGHDVATSDLVKTVRHGHLNKGGSRIVFDLASPATILKAFTLPAKGKYKNRLVIDVTPVSRNLFLKSKDRVFGKYSSKLAKSQKTFKPQRIERPAIVKEKNGKSLALRVGQATHIYHKKKIHIPKPKPSQMTSRHKATRYVIVIDAGHGGGDPGGLARSRRVKEKNITLNIAKALKKRFEDTGRYKVVLTRDRDKYIKLRQRVAKARKVKGDLFISIHADKIDGKSVRGASIYTLSETASDKETARLAEQENNAGIVAGVDLGIEDDDVADILLDLAVRETMNESQYFAGMLVSSFRQQGVRLLNNSHRYAGFAVLKAPDIPSVLIEAGFLSNKQDVNMLTSYAYHLKFSRAVVSATDKYFKKIRALHDM